MKILIFGAGAVGSLFGGFLAKAGHEVSLLGRCRHMEAIKRNGLIIKGIWGELQIRGFKLFDSVSEVVKEAIKYDLIFLTVKSYDTESCCKDLLRLADERTALISFQNGLGNIESVLKYIQPKHYLIGRIITGVDITPGAIDITVSADGMAVGSVRGAAPHFSPARMAQVLTDAQIPARSVPNILTLIWSKVIYNCALNGPCSILGIPYGKMLDQGETRETLKKVVYECYEVAARTNIALDPPNAAAYLSLLKNELIPKTASHFPSMLQDLRKGRKTEIEALNGAICRLGRKCGVETPENTRIAALIREMELKHNKKTGKIIKML